MKSDNQKKGIKMSKKIKEQKEDLFTEIFALMEKYY